MLKTYLHRSGKIPTAIHPFEKAARATQLIEQKQEAFWFYRFISVACNHSLARLGSGISAYILLWREGKK